MPTGLVPCSATSELFGFEMVTSPPPPIAMRPDGHVAVAVHQDDERQLGLVFHHERFHHMMLGYAELARRHRGAASQLVAVLVLGEDQAVPSERMYRGGR